jgi:hypothetical protein
MRRAWILDAILIVLVWSVLSARAGDFLPKVLTYSELQNVTYLGYPIARSDDLVYTLPANANMQGQWFGNISTNAYGFRGPDPQTLAKPNGVTRILFLGDSFTLGWGVDDPDSLPALVRADLNARADYPPTMDT